VGAWPAYSALASIGWTSADIISMVWIGAGCDTQTPFQPAANAFTNDPLVIPAVTTRPFASFPVDDSFTASDPGWTYETTAHVAPG
jgi:hypothetical protein